MKYFKFERGSLSIRVWEPVHHIILPEIRDTNKYQYLSILPYLESSFKKSNKDEGEKFAM